MIQEEGKVGIEENFPKYSEEIGKSKQNHGDKKKKILFCQKLFGPDKI